MKTIDNYLIERLKLNSDSKINNNQLIGYKEFITLLNNHKNPFGLVELNSNIKTYKKHHWYHYVKDGEDRYIFIIDTPNLNNNNYYHYNWWWTVQIKETKKLIKDHMMIYMCRVWENLDDDHTSNYDFTDMHPRKIKLQGKSGHDLSFIELFFGMLENFKQDQFDIQEKKESFLRYKKRFTNLGYFETNEKF